MVQVSKFQHSQTKSTGREQPATPFHRDRQGLPRTLRDHVRSSSALSAFKKRLVANLSAKLQLSVAKLSTKGIFSLAKRDFLVANGRMAADFSSPADSLATESCRLADRLATKHFFQGGQRRCIIIYAAERDRARCVAVFVGPRCIGVGRSDPVDHVCE